MEYMQMTLNDWLEMKQSLERELSNLKTGFIRVGYCLRRIEESRGYEQDGYKSIAEFAKAEYGLNASTVSRFMAINERFSLGGYSERLDPQFIGFKQSIMGELLGLPEQDLELVTPETSRADVRELKQFNKQEPAKGIADDIRSLLESYFRDNREELNMLYDGSGQVTKDILNPSGNKVFRKGMYMLFFYPENVKTKKFGGETVTYTWEEFRDLIDGVFAGSAGADTYANYFEEPVPEPESETKEAEITETRTALAQEPETQEPQQVQEQKPDTPKPQPVSGNLPGAEAVEESREPERASERPAQQIETEEDTVEGCSEAEKKEPEAIAPAQKNRIKRENQGEDAVLPEYNRKAEYDRAVSDVEEKLEEIRQSLTEKNWYRMSEQVLSLGFIVNQLKVMGNIAD